MASVSRAIIRSSSVATKHDDRIAILGNASVALRHVHSVALRIELKTEESKVLDYHASNRRSIFASTLPRSIEPLVSSSITEKLLIEELPQLITRTLPLWINFASSLKWHRP